MEDYINLIRGVYDIPEEYIIEQEYDEVSILYQVTIYTFIENAKLPLVITEHLTEFHKELDKLISQKFPGYLRSSLTIYIFQSKIWITFIPF